MTSVHHGQLNVHAIKLVKIIYAKAKKKAFRSKFNIYIFFFAQRTLVA